MTTVRAAHEDDWPAIEGLLISNGLPLAGARDHLSAFVVVDGAEGLEGCAGLEKFGTVGLLRRWRLRWTRAVKDWARRCSTRSWPALASKD